MTSQQIPLVYWTSQKPINKWYFLAGYIDDFMLCCSSKNFSRMTLASYEQILKALFLKNNFSIEEVKKVQSSHISQYIKYLRERDKYTVVNELESKDKIHLEKRTDYRKEVSYLPPINRWHFLWVA